MTNLAALLWTFSSYPGALFGMDPTPDCSYSSLGLTKVLYAISFVRGEQFHRLRFSKPRMLFAFVDRLIYVSRPSQLVGYFNSKVRVVAYRFQDGVFSFYSDEGVERFLMGHMHDKTLGCIKLHLPS